MRNYFIYSGCSFKQQHNRLLLNPNYVHTGKKKYKLLSNIKSQAYSTFLQATCLFVKKKKLLKRLKYPTTLNATPEQEMWKKEREMTQTYISFCRFKYLTVECRIRLSVNATTGAYKAIQTGQTLSLAHTAVRASMLQGNVFCVEHLV